MAKKTTNLENKTVLFDFDDGADPVPFELSKCSKAMIVQLALHGASQKTGDSYASAKKVCADTDINPVAWSREQAEGVVEQLYNDDWTVRVPGIAAVTDLATALAEVIEGVTVDAAIARLAESDKDEKAALRKHPDIAAVLARIKSERAAAKAEQASKKAGTGEDLSGFMGG